MCIIIDNSKGMKLPEEVILSSVWINSDGFGITYLDTEEGPDTLWTMDMDEAAQLLAEERKFVAHCRYTTKGKTCIENNHPFQLNDGSFFYHNGTIKGLRPMKKGSSDTATMAELLNMVDPKDRVKFLKRFTEGNRFCLVTAQGKVHRMGRWHEQDGVHYSKDDVLQDYGVVGYNNYGAYSEYGNFDNYGTDSYYANADKHSNSSYLSTEQTARLLDDDFDQKFGYHSESLDGEHAYNTPFEDDIDGSDETIIFSEEKHVVAVYGTLKQNLSNHGLLADSYFVGDAETEDPMRLCINGLPYMIKGTHSDGLPVSCEIYLVDDATLADLDRLEGHPTFYERTKLWLNLTSSGSAIEAWVYQVPDTAEYNTGEFHLSYTPQYRGSYTPSMLK